MLTDEIIQVLGYGDSPRFLRESDVAQAPQHAQAFRRAFRDCGVRGIYLLRDDVTRDSCAPALYVAEAGSARDADEIHKKVWNQNVVPFLLVRTPEDIRLYSGFQYRPPDEETSPEQRGVLSASIAFADVLERLKDLSSSAIDDGTVWRTWGRRIDPSTRVDWTLLENLNALGRWLRKEPAQDGKRLDPQVAHSLIGKFVYLRYLRDRGILSDWKLRDLDVDAEKAFGRGATITGVRTLVGAVDSWLNGSIFPLSLSGPNAPKTEHVQRVSGVFLGDDPQTGQLHLDFRAYDFSFIPIETLSVIYEQFLSAESANRDKGAYYTPLHLVNFMLGELDGMRPLEPGMSVFDPSCGSGAFLVQCYRRIVERHLASGGSKNPSVLRDLLVENIFGVDRDPEACQVTGLSLILAMLDYVDPPDLHRTSKFKLPYLVKATPDDEGKNIFVADFFDPDAEWATRQHDWVVGNPPWLQVDKKDTSPASRWMKSHEQTHPVTNNEVAEAFAWKAMDHVKVRGAVGLLLPAMTLYKDSTAFRSGYFTKHDVAAVANFTNFRRDLFKKAETPAAAFFTWGSRHPGGEPREHVIVFAPFVAKQVTNGTRPGERHEPWVITVEHSDLHQVSFEAIRDGDMLPWKVAMWGGLRDMRLLRSMRNVPTLNDFVKKHGLAISEGLQLRERSAHEAVEAVPEIVGKPLLDLKVLKEAGRIYAFPPVALEQKVPASAAFARRRGGLKLPLSVCQPPHVIVAQVRSFAAYSSDMVVVPARQPGIAGGAQHALRLKALALYLNTDFPSFHQFLVASQAEWRGGHASLQNLRDLPLPLDDLDAKGIARWAKLYDDLSATQGKVWASRGKKDVPVRGVDTSTFEQHIAKLEAEANEEVANLLKLKDDERVLIRDLVHVRRKMADGLVPPEVTRSPEEAELEAYATRLARTLDRAIPDTETRRHDVVVVQDGSTGMVRIELADVKLGARSRVFDASGSVGRSFATIRQRMVSQREQWLYFDKNLFLFDGPRTYIMKPLQRLWWLESQALADADHFVGAALAPRGNG